MSVLFINAAPIGILAPLFEMTRAPQVDAAGLTSVVSELGRNLAQPAALGMEDGERAQVQNVLHTLYENISTNNVGGVVPSRALEPTLHSLLKAWPARLNRRETPPDDISQEYCVWDSIGSGGCSRVCLAYSRETGNITVVKIAQASEGVTQEAAEKVLRDEYDILSSLEEGTGPRVYRLGTLRGQLCVVMEYLDTEDLADALPGLQHELNTAADLDRLLDVARQAVQTIIPIHRQGIVHADIKPENFKYQDGRMRVFDFGIASRSGVVINYITGTPIYMPPESFYDGAVSSPRRDVYALGAMIYEMLTGQAPFKADSTDEVIRRTVDPNDRPEWPSVVLLQNHPELRGRVSPALLTLVDKIVMKALDRDPNNRYADADELFRALRNAVSPGRPIAPAAPVPVPRPVPVAAPRRDDSLRRTRNDNPNRVAKVSKGGGANNG